AFLRQAERYYRHADGSPTSEVDGFKLAIRQLRHLYGALPAKSFAPEHLKTLRGQMVKDDLCRGVINQRVGKIKPIFRWAAGESLIPPSVHHGLQCVAGLPVGRGLARETEPVKPVPEAFVEAIRNHVLPEVWAMIELQRLTGMRPGEVCRMR